MRLYTNHIGQQFVRTSDTHGRIGAVPVEFETPEELREWLWENEFYSTELEEARP
jgi:hypothetical protein